MECTIYVAKGNALINCAAVLTAQLICTFVFAYIKGRFSHDVVHTTIGNGKNIRSCLISRSTFYLHQLDT